MTDQINEPFHWNVYFIGPEGFREHFYVSAEDAETLSARRAALLGFLKEWSAVSDVRPPLWGDNSSGVKTSSKLDKFKDKPAGEVKEEPMTAAAVASGIAPADKPTEEVPAPAPTKSSSKLAKAAGKTATVVADTTNTKTSTPTSLPADTLAKSKLAKYARLEKS